MNRREHLKALAILSTMLYAPTGRAITPIVAAIIPTVIGGLMAIWVALRQEVQAAQFQAQNLESNRLNMALTAQLALRMEHIQLWAARITAGEKVTPADYGNVQIIQPFVFEQGRPMNAGLSNNADNYGTHAGLHLGSISLARARYGATITPLEAVEFRNQVLHHGEPILPVPTQQQPRLVRAGTPYADEVSNAIAARRGMRDGKEVTSKYVVLASRDYSQARDITERGADLRAAVLYEKRGTSRYGVPPLEVQFIDKA